MALLTVSQIREAVDTSLSDDRVQDILDATEQDIIGAAGATDEQTEYVPGGYFSHLVLSRPVGVIDSVTEQADTAAALELAADDYRVDGYILKRLTTGTNPRSWWNGLVKVVHDPADRLAERKRAQIALFRLELAYSSGVTSERIGDYSVQFAGSPGGTSYEDAKAQILSSLAPVLAR